MAPILMTNRRRIQLFWVMTTLLVILFTINSLGTCIIAALMGKQWNMMPATEKFLLVVVILVNWTTMMMAFLNRSINHLIGEVANPLSTEVIQPKQNIE